MPPFEAVRFAAVPPYVSPTVPLLISLPAMLLFVSVSVVALPTSVSVAAGRLTVTVPSAPVTGCNVSKPDVALPNVTDPRVPALPSVGVDVYVGAAEEPVAFPRTVPAPAFARAAVTVPLVVTAEDGVEERTVPSPVNVTDVTVPAFEDVVPQVMPVPET